MYSQKAAARVGGGLFLRYVTAREKPPFDVERTLYIVPASPDGLTHHFHGCQQAGCEREAGEQNDGLRRGGASLVMGFCSVAAPRLGAGGGSRSVGIADAWTSIEALHKGFAFHAYRRQRTKEGGCAMKRNDGTPPCGNRAVAEARGFRRAVVIFSCLSPWRPWRRAQPWRIPPRPWAAPWRRCP